ncbi:hypothetical protein LY11_00757 [Pedobacter cryoconitis]|uniref:Uncharacterized protein n=1 Tax=Pedobacter cryoconitis TaxID=188932 RepID=A0A327T704_9SPHI|nr:hypothetical protein LY11_00757 [Pedobacter cryoconitis]
MLYRFILKYKDTPIFKKKYIILADCLNAFNLKCPLPDFTDTKLI